MDFKYKDIAQVIGCAYTYEVSRAVRDAFSKTREDHSSHQGKSAFSYFKKVENTKDIVKNGEYLLMRKNLGDDKEIIHWSEPEFAIVLGGKHEIIGFALANDFTAAGVEFKKSSKGFDPTYFGKCWKGSLSIGPKFLDESEITNLDNLEIGLRVERNNKTIYNQTYSTSYRKRDFSDFPSMILDYRKSLGKNLPASKQIIVEKGFLPFGTVILAGTGLIVPKTAYTKEGDNCIVYSNQFGELKNRVL